MPKQKASVMKQPGGGSMMDRLKVVDSVEPLLSGKMLNADINGSYNIMRKALPNALTGNGIEDVNKMLASLVVHPVRIVVPLRTPNV
jgi:hypothetical protein